MPFTPIEEITVFKDGHAFVAHEGLTGLVRLARSGGDELTTSVEAVLFTSARV